MYDRQEIFRHITKSINIEVGKPITLHTIGDFHYGSDNFSQDAWDEWKERWAHKFKTKTHYSLIVGDIFNSFRKTDQYKLQSMLSLEPLLDLQKIAITNANTLYNEAKFMQDYVLALINGNHDFYLIDHKKTVDEYFAELLNAPFGGGITALHLTLKNKKFDNKLKIIMIHGRSASTVYLGSNLNELERKAREWRADIVVAGHSHQMVSGKGAALDFDEKTVYDNIFVIQRTGSFYRNYRDNCSSYANKAGYKPAVIGQNYITVELLKTGELRTEYHG